VLIDREERTERPLEAQKVTSLSNAFTEALALLRDAGEQMRPAADSLSDLAQRLEAETFHLAVLGQFKRGKSTLLNALLGQEVLPTSVVPLTAIPTFIRWGETPQVRVIFNGESPPDQLSADSPGDLSAFLSRYVTEESNPENRLGVRLAEATLPEEILSRGLVLIDTPGIGSTYQHNTETTLNFLPQCDAALFMVSADPPVTEVELTFLKEVRRKVRHLIFVFNKVDYLRPGDREQALGFFSRVLSEEAGFTDGVDIFPLSALHGLEGRLNGDQRLVAESGLQAVLEYLVGFLMSEKTKILRQAVASEASEFLAEVLLQIELTIRSLTMPMENLESRLASLEDRVQETDRQRETAGDLLAGDRRRAVRFLEEQAGLLRERSRVHIDNVVAGALTRKGEASSLEGLARAALDEAIPGFFEHELGTISLEFDSHVAEVLRPHQKRADELMESIRAAASELFEIPYSAPESTGVFETRSQPYWVTRKWSTSLNPIPAGLFDVLLPQALKRSVVAKRLMKQVDDLVVHNVENLRWATLQNLDRAFRLFSTSLDNRLAGTVESTHGAIKAVIEDRKRHADRAAKRLPGLEDTARRLGDLKKQFEITADISTDTSGGDNNGPHLG